MNRLARYQGRGVDFRARVAKIKADRARQARLADTAVVLAGVTLGLFIATAIAGYALLCCGHFPY